MLGICVITLILQHHGKCMVLRGPDSTKKHATETLFL